MLRTCVFPGQGSQNKGMGEDLFDRYADWVSTADEVLGYSIKELCLTDADNQLNNTQYTQPALYTVNALSYRKMIDDTGRYPDYLAGHSLGEYNALLASGAIDFQSGLHLVKKRGQLMSQVSGGGMTAVLGVSDEVIENILKAHNLMAIDIANYNTPSQFVISGLKNEIDAVCEVFKKQDIMFIPLNVSAAFHSRNMRSVKEKFSSYLENFYFSGMYTPVISNVTARPYRQLDIKNNLINQITESVKWTESVQYLLDADDMEFEEIGPGHVLTGLIKKIRREIDVAA